MIDGSGRMGRGVAYSTTESVHLLNVRAESMSAIAGKPADFVKRFEAEGGDPRGFAQRRFFGRYLDEILDRAVSGGCVQPVAALADRAERANGAWKINLASEEPIEARVLALAIGNQQPQSLRAFDDAGASYIANPWGRESSAAVRDLIAGGGDVLLVGTGLTMVDLALSLDAAGYRGRIVAVSRRGLLPRAHAEFAAAPVEAGDVPHGRMLDLWRWLRGRSAQVGWRAAVDSLRPHSHALWTSLDATDQRRFLRHARPWWDVHRHRIAPQVAATITGMIAEDRLQVIAGRVTSANVIPNGLEVEIRPRGSERLQRMTFAYAFNCTGPLHAIDQTSDPLLRSLLDEGAARPDRLGIGLEVDENARAGERLWALGPLTKGRYWEITAVPDIREQAAAIAEDIARELKE